MKLNVGIIGIGNMGKAHYHIYKNSENIGRIYLVDINPRALRKLKGAYFPDYKAIAKKVDLVSIAVPTTLHYEIASFFLNNNIPVLVEKPISKSIREAAKLINLSRNNKTFLFVGHVERYNNAYIAARKMIHEPKFIECHRLSPYPYRSLDTSVVLDLMIHDIDIILDITKDSIRKIAAKGVKVLSRTEDIANARLTFNKGCVANITSSRISVKKERKLRIFMPNQYISLDYIQQKVEVYKKARKTITREILPIDKEQPLKNEIHKFIDFVKKGTITTRYAEKAKDALSLSLKIQKSIEK